MKILFILCVCWTFSLSAMAQVVPISESSKKQALQYIRKAHSVLCIDKNTSYIPTEYFQSELFAIDKKYTLELLEHIDNQQYYVREKSDITPLIQSRCEYDLRFSSTQLDNFILCEVIPKGDRTFIITEVYLFQITKINLRFISKKDLNYN